MPWRYTLVKIAERMHAWPADVEARPKAELLELLQWWQIENDAQGR